MRVYGNRTEDRYVRTYIGFSNVKVKIVFFNSLNEHWPASVFKFFYIMNCLTAILMWA